MSNSKEYSFLIPNHERKKWRNFGKELLYHTYSLIPESCMLQNNILPPRFLLCNCFDSSAEHFITTLDATQRTSWIGGINGISEELIKAMAILPFYTVTSLLCY